MTREEHISNLETIGCDGWTVTTEAYKSLQFAIKALELIPDDATNGDVMMSVFPDSKIEHKGEHIVFVKLSGSFVGYEFDADWWNAQYRKE